MSEKNIFDLSNKDELKRAFMEIKEEEFEDVPGEDEIPLEVSESFRDKVISTGARKTSRWGRFINSTARKVAVVAAVMIIAFGGLMSVEAIRGPVVTFIKTTYEKTSALFRPSSEPKTLAPETEETSEDGNDAEYDTGYSSVIGNDGTDTNEPETTDAADPETETDSGEVGKDAPETNEQNEGQMPAAPAETADPDDEMIEQVPATCEEEGYTLMRRAGSDETYKTDIVPALGHDYELTKKVYSTCTVPGHASYKCTRCGAEYTEELKLGSHNWVLQDHVVKCGQLEEFHFICGICRKTRVEYSKTIGHVLDYVKYVNPTCTEEGYVLYKCHDCGEMVKVTNHNAYGHNLQTAVTKPTCTEEGYSITKCTRCKQTFGDKFDFTPALGHSFYGVRHDFDGHYTGTGYEQCSRCGELVEVCNINSETGHYYYEEVYEPTCTEDGYSQKCCALCGKLSEPYDIVPATGHDYKTMTKNPTCTTPGGTYLKCRNCGEIGNTDETIPALGHDYVETQHTNPTCVKEGSVTYKCSRCKHTYSETVGPTGVHNYKILYVTPSCTKEGYTLYTCKSCGHQEKRDFIPAAGHNFELWEVVEPTATEEGYTVYRCTVCHAKEKRDFVPALGATASSIVNAIKKLSPGLD